MIGYDGCEISSKHDNMHSTDMKMYKNVCYIKMTLNYALKSSKNNELGV